MKSSLPPGAFADSIHTHPIGTYTERALARSLFSNGTARLCFAATMTVAIAAAAARADVIHVPDDQPTIQAGVDAAVTGDEVVVAPGEYILGEFENVTINQKSVTVRSSGGAEATTIQGGGAFPVMHLGLNDSTIQGFTITGRVQYSLFAGGGISILGGSPTIRDCTFINNVAEDVLKGGAVGGSNASCTIIGCTFIKNSSYDGGAVRMDLSASITDSTFDGNSATHYHGGAVSISSGTIENCTFTGNLANLDGAAVYSNGSVSIRESTFTGNHASRDGGAVHTGGGDLTDCTSEMNEGSSGGGAWVDSDTTVSGCTFDDNTATSNGGGIHIGGASSTVTRCTFQANDASGTGGGLYLGAGATATMTDSTLCGNIPDDIDSNGVLNASGVVIAVDGADCQSAVSIFGACSVPGGACVTTTAPSCESAGGDYLGDGMTCDDVPPRIPGDVDGDGDFDLDDVAHLLAGFSGPLP